MLNLSSSVDGDAGPSAAHPTARVQITPAQCSSSSAFSISILQHTYPLRLFAPQTKNRQQNCAWIYVSNYGGGFVDGDKVILQIDIVDDDQQHSNDLCAVITSIGSTKIYAGSARSLQTATVSSNCTLLLLQKPVVPFRNSHFTQQTRIALRDTTSSLCCVDWLQCGRRSYGVGGERWQQKLTDNTLEVTVNNMPFYFDRFVIKSDDDDMRMRQMGRISIFGSVILCGPKFEKLSQHLLTKCQTRYEYGQRPTTRAGFLSANKLELLTISNKHDDDDAELSMLNAPKPHGCVVKLAFEQLEQAEQWLDENVMPTLLDITGGSSLQF